KYYTINTTTPPNATRILQTADLNIQGLFKTYTQTLSGDFKRD
ncbi:MAG: hypothetical protein EZS28_013471, partial [Streblomastix strix]